MIFIVLREYSRNYGFAQSANGVDLPRLFQPVEPGDLEQSKIQGKKGFSLSISLPKLTGGLKNSSDALANSVEELVKDRDRRISKIKGKIGGFFKKVTCVICFLSVSDRVGRQQ